MARQLKRLTTRTVATLTKIGRHADGGNLYLTISKRTAGYRNAGRSCLHSLGSSVKQALALHRL